MISHNILKNMVMLNDNRSRRISSWDRTGGNRDFLRVNPGETVVLAEIQGPAIINHFYVTLLSRDLFAYRTLVLRMYWDGEATPSVEAPLGDFFGVPFGDPQYFQSLVVSVNPGTDRNLTDGLNVYFPMPFARGARIELFNDSPVLVQNFWYHINYETVPALEPGMGYFHARWNREAPCKRAIPPGKKESEIAPGDWVNLDGADNYVILDARGKGNYAGCIVQIDNLIHEWYGEGDDMIFIDGEAWPPSLHGTGTEEIFGGGACPNEPYFTPYCGYLQVESPKDFHGRNAMYKFFVNDPVRFQKSIRVTLEHGHANDMANDYSSLAYWYQEEPHAAPPVFPNAARRIPRLPEGFETAYEMAQEAAAIFTEMDISGTFENEDRASLRKPFFDTRAAILARKPEEARAAAEGYLDACRKTKAR